MRLFSNQMTEKFDKMDDLLEDMEIKIRQGRPITPNDFLDIFLEIRKILEIQNRDDN